MPSTEHERAQHGIAEILEDVLSPEDIVAVELMMLLDPLDWHRHLTPDVFVALGVGALDPVYGVLRRQYRLWDEGRVPDLVYEGASPSTFARDSAGKKEHYAALGVREYVQFDPTGGLLSPRLQVFRLVRPGTYQRVAPAADGAVRSVTLPRYDWVIGGYLLRLRERASGLLVPLPRERARTEATRAEAEARRARAEEERANAEAARAQSAEAEVARLRAELNRLRDGA